MTTAIELNCDIQSTVSSAITAAAETGSRNKTKKDLGWKKNRSIQPGT